MPQPSYTALVDTAPLDQVQALYDVWKTRNIKSPAAALAVVNFASYGAYLAVGQTIPQPFGASPLDDSAIEAAFAEARTFGAEGGVLDNRPFLKILAQIAIKLLPLILI